MISGFFILVLLFWCDSSSRRIRRLKQEVCHADPAPL